MMVLIFVLVSLGIYSLLGYKMSLVLFGAGESKHPSDNLAGFFAAPIFGYFIYSFSVYAISTTLGVGIGKFALPLLLLLAVLALAANLFNSHFSLSQVLPFLRGRFVLLSAVVVAWALASFHIWFPMVLNDWEMAYSIGNDSARYVAMIEYLQQSFWTYGGNLTEPLSYPFGNRPLMHYQQAIPVAIFPISIALSYSISSIINTCLTFNAIILLGLMVCRRFSYLGIYVVALGTGLAGGGFNYYYSGFVGHYFSVLAIIFTLGSLYWVGSYRNRSIATLFLLGVVAASYSVGFAILTAVLLCVGWFGKAFQSEISKADLIKEVFTSVSSIIIVALVFKYELVVGGGFDLVARNPSYYFEFPKAVLVYSGILSKWQDVSSIASVYVLWGAIFSAILLPIVALFYAWKIRSSWFYVSGIFFIFVVGLYLSGNYYLFNKHAILFSPLILVAAYAMVSDVKWGIGLGRFLVAGAILVVCYFGYVTMSSFHVEIAKARKSFVDQTMHASKSVLHEFLPSGGVIYSADIGVERNLLIRVLFSEFAWLPTGEKNVLAEYGLTSERQLQRLFNEDPPVIFVAKDYAEAQWAGYQMRQGDIFDGDWFGFYKNVGIIELEGDWQLVGEVALDETRQKRRYTKRIPKAGGVHLVNTSCKEMIIELESSSPLSDLEFYDGAGKKLVPLTKVEQGKASLTFNCHKLTPTRNNYLIKVNAPHEDYVVSSIITR